jgi:hypothetical protein
MASLHALNSEPVKIKSGNDPEQRDSPLHTKRACGSFSRLAIERNLK